MSAPLRAISAAFRRRLLAQPGITALPVCPWCGKQVPAKAWGREACQTCESERAEASDYFQAQLDATLADEPSPPAEPMFGSDEAGQPFLPHDEDYWTEQQRLAEDRQAHEAAEQHDAGQTDGHVGRTEEL